MSLETDDENIIVFRIEDEKIRRRCVYKNVMAAMITRFIPRHNAFFGINCSEERI